MTGHPTRDSSSSRRRYLLSMAWVRFSSCVETVSNSSSTAEEEVQRPRCWGGPGSQGRLHPVWSSPPASTPRGGLTFVVVVGGGEGTLVDVVGQEAVQGILEGREGRLVVRVQDRALMFVQMLQEAEGLGRGRGGPHTQTELMVRPGDSRTGP